MNKIDVLTRLGRTFINYPKKIVNKVKVLTGIESLSTAIAKNEPKKSFTKDLQSQFKELMVIIVSIIQGLIFTTLAEKFTLLIKDFSLIDMVNIVLCFVILLRIFQTHLLAAYKYIGLWSISIVDLFLIFAIGLFEYVLFSFVDPKNSDYETFYILLLSFSIFGALGYARAYYEISNAELSKEGMVIEKAIQTLNILLSALVAIPCLLVILTYKGIILSLSDLDYLLVIAPMAIIIIIVSNIYSSLTLSFKT